MRACIILDSSLASDELKESRTSAVIQRRARCSVVEYTSAPFSCPSLPLFFAEAETPVLPFVTMCQTTGTMLCLLSTDGLLSALTMTTVLLLGTNKVGEYMATTAPNNGQVRLFFCVNYVQLLLNV
jgi:hypothetical protein